MLFSTESHTCGTRKKNSKLSKDISGMNDFGQAKIFSREETAEIAMT